MMMFGTSREQDFVNMIAQCERLRCERIVEAAAMAGQTLFDALAAIREGAEPGTIAAASSMRAQPTPGGRQMGPQEMAARQYLAQVEEFSSARAGSSHDRATEEGIDLWLATRPRGGSQGHQNDGSLAEVSK